MLIALLFAVALALAYANGANDNFKASATLYGSGVASYAEARRLATLAQLCGSVASVVLAGALLEAFSGKGLVPPAVVGDPRSWSRSGPLPPPRSCWRHGWVCRSRRPTRSSEVSPARAWPWRPAGSPGRRLGAAISCPCS